MAIQRKDRIYLDGELFELLSTPLNAFFEAHPEIPSFRGKMPECRKGYMASWRIRNNVLYLTGFQQVSPTVVINHRDVLSNPKKVADWYSGKLRIPLVAIIHSSKERGVLHEKEMHIHIENGIVYNHEVVFDKNTAPDNSENKPFKRSSE
ncbi:hypothetical protein [uncultured Draconibacterium sp.]|uniref:hypothetical protein n=1 Tax=uncultured Draconibacterium sp. TaxID=1573823 RepID=UPI002AA61725|nr:hypothetical protein [uncultured Draconibacterium sp.]